MYIYICIYIWHLRKPPAWMRPMRKDTLKLQILEQGIPSKEQALVLEALHAARQMVRFPFLARGGPWVRPTLPLVKLAPQIKAVAACRTLLRVNEVASQFSLTCNLQKHLKDLAFESSASAGSYRGAVVRRCRSGKTNWHNWKRRRDPGARKKPAMYLSGAEKRKRARVRAALSDPF